jgi:hypothetical protein
MVESGEEVLEKNKRRSKAILAAVPSNLLPMVGTVDSLFHLF